MDTSWLPLAAFILTAIGWISREVWRWQKAKRLATEDAVNTLHQKKALIKDLISKTGDSNDKDTLIAQLNEVDVALMALLTQRLRQTLKDVGLPTEAALIANGQSQLKPQEAAQLNKVIKEANALPLSSSIQDLQILGDAYYHTKQYQNAKDTYDKILKLNPDNPFALNNRGVIYTMLERYDEALSNYSHALELKPDLPEALNNRGNIYAVLERYDEAFTDFNHSLGLRPDFPGTLYNRAKTYQKIERYNEALADYNRSLQIKPDYPEALYDLACLLSLCGCCQSAKWDTNRATKTVHFRRVA